MADFPETRASLLARLKRPADEAAWHELVALYQPAIYRLARRRGLQPADAEELSQRVFVAVAKTIDDWDPDPSRGLFRAWIQKVARNAIRNALARRPRDAAQGGSSALARLENEADEGDCDEEALAREFDQEHQRQLFRLAAATVRGQVHHDTWQAFWLTAVEGKPCEVVARLLDKQLGAVYAARSRVMRRLRDAVRQQNQDSTEPRP